MSPKGKRLIELDVFKGILIIAVIFGHSDFAYARVMYMFHMPAFFLISGFLFKESSTVLELKCKIIGKSKSLMIPYIVFTFGIVIIAALFEIVTIDINYILKAFYGGKLMYGILGVFWFVTVLLMTYILFSLASFFIKSKTKFITLILMCFLLARLEYYMIFFEHKALILPLNIDSVLMAVFFFFLGHMFKEHYQDIKIKVIHKTILFFIMALGVFLSVFVIPIDFQFDMKYQQYGTIYWNLTIPIVMSFCLLIISIAMSKFALFKTIFVIIGQASLVIMYLHLLIKQLLISFDIYNLHTYVLLSIVLPVFFYKLIERSPLLSFLLLGKPRRKLSVNNP